MNLTDYYVGELEKDFICSNDSGMTKCFDVPAFHYQNRKELCNASAVPGGDGNLPTNESCVNWNQYYNDCRPVGSNPFQGAISFDNIGLAWVAIFQVYKRKPFFSSFSGRFRVFWFELADIIY